MVRNPFSSSKIRPSLAEAIKTANDCLKMACNDSDLKTALQLADEAKSKIQEAEKIFATERVGKPTIDNGIAIAYHEHGKLLDKLRSHKAQESYSNAKKWGYIEVVNQQIYSPLLGDMDSSNRRSVIHLIALAAIPNLSTAIRQDIPGLGAILPISNDLAEVPPTKTYDIANHQDIYLYSGLDVEVAIIKLRRQRLMNKGEPYVMPRAKRYLNSEETFDLTYDVQGFLKSDKKVFLLLGDSGAGKSTFIRALETKLWTAYQEDTNKNIPIFVDLPSIANPEQDLIAKQLRRFDFTEEQIMDLKSQRQITLICDGYDECHQTTNLYKSNQLNQPGGWVVQMVISCGTEYIGMDYKDRFQPIDQNNCRVSNLFQEAVVMPFNKNQIQDYINQYVSVNKSTTTNWSADDYKKAIGDIPNLLELVVDPFLLKLAVEVLPQLVDLRKDVSSKITRIVLYDIFVAQWIERSMLRLMTTTLTPRDKESFKTLTTSGFTEHSINYLKELATKVYYNQGGNPVIDHIGYRDRGTLKESFSDDTEDKNLLREAIPIVRDGGQYRFIHKSILEYGLALAVYDPNTQNHMSVPSRSLESLPLTEWVAAADERSLLDSPLRKRNLVGERSILQFLAERVQQEPVFKDQLLSVIERSKSDKTVGIAAANAITILVRAGVQFNNADLRNIKIQGADLSFGMFDSVQLEGADLWKVNLRNVWMRQANLRGAQMTGVQFGELPFLKENSEVYCSAYSPDGKTLAVGLYDGNISLYETSSWERIQTLKGHDGCVNSLSFSVTSNQIASGSWDLTVRLWDVDTGKCIHALRSHHWGVNSVVYSPKGDQIASGSRDETVRLWDVDTGECVRTLQGHSDYVNSVAYSPKGDRIASGSSDRTVRLWDVDTGKCIHTLWDHSDWVRSVVYSPKGDRIASGSYDRTVRLWDVDTGECVRILGGHRNHVNCVIYSPKGDRIASGSHDRTVRLWDVDTGECIRTLQGHSDIVNSVVYSPKGDLVVSGSKDKTVRLWGVDIGKYVRTLQSHSDWVRSVVYSPKGDRVASGSNDTTVRLWDVDTGECVHTLQGHSDMVNSVVYSPKGKWIASGSKDKTVRLWDVDTGKCIHTLHGHSRDVNSVVYSPKGDQIASGSYDRTVRLWDVDTGECVHTLQGHRDWVRSVVYSPKGDRVASGSNDTTVRLWDVDTGECVHTLQGHSDWVQSLVYSPKGDRIASGSLDFTVRLWDIDTGKCVHTLHGRGWHATSVAYSPKGDWIASGSDDSTVRLWDVDTGACVRALKGHSNTVNSVVYSPKGDRIASGSSDCTMRLWDVDTGESLAIISEFGSGVHSIAWEDNFGAQCLVTSSQGKSVRIWQVIKEGIEIKVVLRWSSSHEVLTVNNLSFEDVQGLSRLSQKLLMQRGALIPKTLPSEQ